MDYDQLTPRQRDVTREMCKGKSNKEIARALCMAEATVKLHLTEIFKTLGVRSRTQAIIKAIDIPVTTPEPLTDLMILEEFANVAFTTLNDTWSSRVIRFGHAVEKRTRG